MVNDKVPGRWLPLSCSARLQARGVWKLESASVPRQRWLLGYRDPGSRVRKLRSTRVKDRPRRQLISRTRQSLQHTVFVRIHRDLPVEKRPAQHANHYGDGNNFLSIVHFFYLPVCPQPPWLQVGALATSEPRKAGASGSLIERAESVQVSIRSLAQRPEPQRSRSALSSSHSPELALLVIPHWRIVRPHAHHH